jgi:hypothetical protein
VPRVKPKSVHVAFDLSSLDEDVAGIEVGDVVALEVLYLEILNRIDISSISSSEKPVFALLQTIALKAPLGRWLSSCAPFLKLIKAKQSEAQLSNDVE